MKSFRNESPRSPSIRLMKSGTLCREEKDIHMSSKLEDICKKEKIKIEYDLSMPDSPEILTYTEIFGKTGSLYVKPGEYKSAYDLIKKAYENGVPDLRVRDIILSVSSDKYNLWDPLKKYTKVVFPAGSNILKESNDWALIVRAMVEGAYIKPHPLTKMDDIEFFKTFFPEHRIIPKRVAGYKVLKNAEVIYTSGTSELGLYAILMDKRVYAISIPGESIPKGGYHEVFDFIMTLPPKERLGGICRVLSCPEYSGIFIKGVHTEKDVVEFIINYKELKL